MLRRLSTSVAVYCLAGCATLASHALAQPPAKTAIEPTHADVSYGPAERNVLDFYAAKGDKPAPLLVHIHGGGFVAGDKRQQINPGMVKALQASGIHFASINYRFVDGDKVIFPAPQMDGARAVQFLRTKADDWNIDSKRIACFGGSAGAGISMWIGFHPDLADPSSSDPVLRQSSRIVAVGSFGGQPTYDPIKIRELIGGRAWEHPSIFKVFGLHNADEALHPTPAQQKLYDESSAIYWLTKDDPPVYEVYNEPDGPLPADARPGQGIHHPNFGRMLKERMDDLGIECVFVNGNAGKNKVPNVGADMLDFFKRHFGMSGTAAKPTQ